MKSIFSFLFCVMFVAAAQAADNICYDENNAFTTQAPEGWVADSVKAKELGLCIVYFVEGKDFDSSPAIIYPRLVSSEKSGQAAIQEIVDENTLRLKENSKIFKVVKQPGLKNKSNLKFEFRHFRNGPTPNEFEAVAYHAGKKAVILSVLSTRSEKDFEVHKPKLKEFVRTIKPMTQKELEKFKTK